MNTTNRFDLRRGFGRSALMILLALLLGACTTSREPRPSEPGETAISALDSSGVRVDGIFRADGSIEPSELVGQRLPQQPFYVADLRSAMSEGGFARVQARIISTVGRAMPLEYRFQWFDATGMEVGQGTGGWSTFNLKGREETSITGTARSTDVASFTLFVREIDFKK